MFGVALDVRRQPDRFIGGQAVDRCDLDDSVLAERERSRLVEHDDGEVSRLLESATIADEQTRSCARGSWKSR